MLYNKMPRKSKKIPNQYEKPDYRIYPVRKEEEFIKVNKPLPPNLDSLLNKNGGVLAMFAAPGSGKSNFISGLLLSDSLLKDVFMGGLYVISPTIKNCLTSHFLREYADMIETQYSDALVEAIFNNLMEIPNEDKDLSCLVLDDCMGSLKQNSFMLRWCSTVRHLRNLCIISTQAVKSVPATIRSNISATVTFYQPSSKQLNDIIELHSLMGGEQNFKDCYEEAVSKKYQFLWSDFRDMKLYKWGGELDEPVELWSMYDENGDRTTGNFMNKKPEQIQENTD
jgi:hypothetical protein